MDHHCHDHKERVAIIGTGWAGYALAHGLDLSKYCVTVVSPDTTSNMTPLLASVACGLFDFRLAQEPIRRKSRNLRYIKACVTHIDFEEKTLRCRPAFSHIAMSESKDHEFDVRYDKVVIAPGTMNQHLQRPRRRRIRLLPQNSKRRTSNPQPHQ